MISDQNFISAMFAAILGIGGYFIGYWFGLLDGAERGRNEFQEWNNEHPIFNELAKIPGLEIHIKGPEKTEETEVDDS